MPTNTHTQLDRTVSLADLRDVLSFGLARFSLFNSILLSDHAKNGFFDEEMTGLNLLFDDVRHDLDLIAWGLKSLHEQHPDVSILLHVSKGGPAA